MDQVDHYSFRCSFIPLHCLCVFLIRKILFVHYGDRLADMIRRNLCVLQDDKHLRGPGSELPTKAMNVMHLWELCIFSGWKLEELRARDLSLQGERRKTF